MCDQSFCQCVDEPAPDREVLLLRLRNAIADKEWLTAAANMESMAYDGWRSDWALAIQEVEEEVAWVLHQLGGHGKEERRAEG